MIDSKIPKVIIKELALIDNKYDAIARATGSNYNIFQVLRIETKEVTTHSRMISDLLNPEGWHGMGSLFLELFLESVEMEKPATFDYVRCTTESNYGPIDAENLTGGSLDILLEGLGKPIVIENKIFAGDQENQLLRYYNQLNKDCDLFYLTLFGKEPSKESTGGLDLNIKTISYNKHILEWLENCHHLSIDRPLLRETLKQYINSVKTLTGQSMNDEKNKEIFSKIEKNKESLADLYIQLKSFANNHLDKLVGEIDDKIRQDYPLDNSLIGSYVKTYEEHLVCHFKFGDSNNKGVIFELKTNPIKLSLWTTAWRLDGEDTYGTDPKLIEALKSVGRYEAPLDSMLPVEQLTKEVIVGIEACKQYYESLLKLDTTD